MARIINTEEIKNVIEAYIQSGNLNFLIGSGASLPAIALMGDIELKINSLIGLKKINEADKMSLKFIQELEEKYESINSGFASGEDLVTNGNYFKLLSIIDDLLFERKNLLLPRQANIFTTNYDLFIESAATQIPSLKINDGFDRSSSLNSNFRFAPEQFLDRTYRSGSVYSRQSEVPTINLFKLHGSINWRRSESEIILVKELPKRLNVSQLSSESEVSTSLVERAVILPNIQKFGSTLMDRIYYDLLRIYANSIEKENSVLISFGFSFADEHILDVTRRSLRNPTSQLILFAYDMDAVADLERKFERQRNTLIISPGKDVQIDFVKFNEIIESVIPKKWDINE